jgi:hypothetical protein
MTFMFVYTHFFEYITYYKDYGASFGELFPPRLKINYLELVLKDIEK